MSTQNDEITSLSNINPTASSPKPRLRLRSHTMTNQEAMRGRARIAAEFWPRIRQRCFEECQAERGSHSARCLIAADEQQIALLELLEKFALQEVASLQRDFDEYIADKKRLARELDVAMHGEEGAAKQPSLCDLIGPAEDLRKAVASRDARIAELEQKLKRAGILKEHKNERQQTAREASGHPAHETLQTENRVASASTKAAGEAGTTRNAKQNANESLVVEALKEQP